MTDKNFLSTIEEIIEEAQNGRMYILVDDEDRENEGDLIIPAQMATPDAVNFMAKYGRGLICLTLESKRIDELGLPLMEAKNTSRHETAFTISIEAKEGVSTGISAGDRARTIAAAIDPSKGKEAIATPGHIFPLRAKDGGVLVRAGHTEASVDISRLAGMNPSAVICEIMNDDGTMARLPDLIKFSKRHGLKIATIADLISYRRRTEKQVERLVEKEIESRYGGVQKMFVYKNTINYAEHMAMVKGDLSTSAPAMVRVHAINILDDLLGDHSAGKSHELHKAMEMIGDYGTGVTVIIRESDPKAVSNRVRLRNGEESVGKEPLRDYGVGAQILLDLGVQEMILLSNTERTIVGLEGYGLKVVERRPIPAGSNS
ncbi:MAG: 3,4-dihydroxy-2-butanone-4-phosphate synthase [Rhodospirillales bacterium]|nr:3,4-dihydroxy-2-butanone-4-phosphate synthase [Rhodospirillales bacterium]